MKKEFDSQSVSFGQAVLPILFLLFLIVYGLLIRPVLLEEEKFPLELVFIAASVFAGCQLWYMGLSWSQIVSAFMSKLSLVLPTILILIGIGLVIGTWMVSGTIPMFVYYGVKIIDPQFIYVLAFLIPILFSTFTGTSWGSVGTVGVVIIGVGLAVGAYMPIIAGAVVGGAYFGDKMSPLSDTTNMAAVAVGVDLYDHIKSMMYTTLPSAIIASVLYFGLGFIFPADVTMSNFVSVVETAASIEELFHFNVLLLLPVLIVLYGSYRLMPTIPVLLTSSFAAMILALLVQDYDLTAVVQSAYKGYQVDMASWLDVKPLEMETLFNRGGLYALSEPAIIAIFVFIFIGLLDKLNAMTIVVDRLFGWVKTKSTTILASLFSSSIVNALTSNQYATSFIVAEAFKPKYDEQGISKKVLSRSIEDYGTMIESIIPWTPTAIFLVATLGVPFEDYWYWQFLSLVNLIVAPLLAITGIGCFYNEKNKSNV